MKNLLLLIVGAAMIPASTTTLSAQGVGDLVVPCAIPFYRELDFTVGEWQVYHKSSGKLAGYDRIGRTLRGCAIQQVWTSLDDHFSSNYVPFRMSGRSLTAFNGTQWVQFWVDSHAGVQVLKGGPEKDKFVLRGNGVAGRYEYMLSWARQDDDTLLNIHQRRELSQGEQGQWQTLYEWVYVKNLNQDLIPDDQEDGNSELSR